MTIPIDMLGLEPSGSTLPLTLPITVDQFQCLVDRGDFEKIGGQVELINGRIVRMNPQGPRHSDPMDYLAEWSFEQSNRQFTIRIEKPIQIDELQSCPEPDVVWAIRRRYSDRHPLPSEIHLLIEVSLSSSEFDRTEKMSLYAKANIAEYWQLDVLSRTLTVFEQPSDASYQSVTQYSADSLESIIAPNCMPQAKLNLKQLFQA